MRTPTRRSSIVRAVDLRDRRQRLGLSTWIALTENQEAIDSLESLQAAVTLRDRPALVALYEQIVCDPRHAAELVAEAIDRLDPTVGPEAAINHTTKLMRKGVLVVSGPPLDAA